MFRDRYDLPLSTSSQVAADALVDGVDRILSFDVDVMPVLESAIQADEGFALPYAVLALQLQQQGDAAGAVTSAQRAQSLLSGASPRERSFVETVTKLVPGAAPATTSSTPIAVMTGHLEEYPRDFLLFYQRTSAISLSGAKDRKEQGLARFREAEQIYGDDWAFSASFAMSLQENSHFEEANRRAEVSLRQKPNNATAIHPVAHVFFETNDHSNGEEVLGKWLEGYEWRAPYHCHLAWHMALFALGMGHYERALKIWEDDIAPAKVGTTRLLDAASLLWRLVLYGIEAAEHEWEQMRPLAEAAIGRPAMSFPFSHSALFCAATQDEAGFDRMLGALPALAEKGHPLAGGPMPAFVAGVRAFSHGDYAGAAETMEPFAADFSRFGGSRAQCEVYAETFIEACLRGGKYDWAETAIRARLDRRPSARDQLWLGRALTAEARPEEACEAARSARTLWPTATPSALEAEVLSTLGA